MANSYRGEVDFEAGGSKYTIRLTLGRLREIEQDLQAAKDGEVEGVAIPQQGLDVIHFLGRLARARGGLTQLVYLFRRGLGVDEAEAERVIMDLGVSQAQRIVDLALEWALPNQLRTPRAGGSAGKGLPPVGKT